MPDDYHDIELPRVARQITFVREADEPSDDAEERPKLEHGRPGRLRPFTGVLGTLQGGRHWRFTTLSYLVGWPLVVTERTERITEVHHHSTRHTVERRDTRQTTDGSAPEGVHTRAPRHVRNVRNVTRQFPRLVTPVSHGVERETAIEWRAGGTATPAESDRDRRSERTRWPDTGLSSFPNTSRNASVAPRTRWVYRRARADAGRTGTPRVISGERETERSPHSSRPDGAVRSHRRALSGESAGADTPRAQAVASFRVLRTETARLVRARGSWPGRTDGPRAQTTLLTRTVHTGSDVDPETVDDGGSRLRPTTDLEHQVARRRHRPPRAEQSGRSARETTIVRQAVGFGGTTDFGGTTHGFAIRPRRAGDTRPGERTTGPVDTPRSPSDAETAWRSDLSASVGEPSERRVREVLREATSRTSGLPALRTVVSVPQRTVDRMETPDTGTRTPTLTRETRLQVATESGGGANGDGTDERGSDRNAVLRPGEPHSRERPNPGPNNQTTAQTVTTAPPRSAPGGNDRPELVHKRERGPSPDGRKNDQQPVGSVARTTQGGANDHGPSRGRGRPTAEPYSSPEQHISALETLSNRHMAADPTIDRLVDHLFTRLERKLRIERERRGR